MFEIRLTVSAANAGWTAGDAELKQQIEKVGGRVEISDVFGRHAIGITCGLREKAQVVKLIKEFLGEIYCLDLKREISVGSTAFAHAAKSFKGDSYTYAYSLRQGTGRGTCVRKRKA